MKVNIEIRADRVKDATKLLQLVLSDLIDRSERGGGQILKDESTVLSCVSGKVEMHIDCEQSFKDPIQIGGAH